MIAPADPRTEYGLPAQPWTEYGLPAQPRTLIHVDMIAPAEPRTKISIMKHRLSRGPFSARPVLVSERKEHLRDVRRMVRLPSVSLASLVFPVSTAGTRPICCTTLEYVVQHLDSTLCCPILKSDMVSETAMSVASIFVFHSVYFTCQ